MTAPKEPMTTKVAEALKVIKDILKHQRDGLTTRTLLNLADAYTTLKAALKDYENVKAEVESWKKEETIWKETEAALLAELARHAPLIEAARGVDEDKP